MQRLRLQAEVCADSEVYVRLTPGARIGAVPLVGPATRRVVAGILVEPRFRWPALGAVFNSIGFTAEPALGGSPLVPGSARDVPPWILAGAVIQRVAPPPRLSSTRSQYGACGMPSKAKSGCACEDGKPRGKLLHQKHRQPQQHRHAHHFGGGGEKDARSGNGICAEPLQDERHHGSADPADNAAPDHGKEHDGAENGGER